jgi:hypothetical protein
MIIALSPNVITTKVNLTKKVESRYAEAQTIAEDRYIYLGAFYGSFDHHYRCGIS